MSAMHKGAQALRCNQLGYTFELTRTNGSILYRALATPSPDGCRSKLNQTYDCALFRIQGTNIVTIKESIDNNLRPAYIGGF